jgi:hypothetical protein
VCHLDLRFDPVMEKWELAPFEFDHASPSVPSSRSAKRAGGEES